MQTADEMVCEGDMGWDWEQAKQEEYIQIDANFGQKPFMFDICSQIKVFK
jgi:hypothetical protein